MNARRAVFQVAFVNWRGQWTMDDKTFRTERAAERRAAVVAHERAENGRVSVRRMA